MQFLEVDTLTLTRQERYLMQAAITLVHILSRIPRPSAPRRQQFKKNMSAFIVAASLAINELRNVGGRLPFLLHVLQCTMSKGGSKLLKDITVFSPRHRADHVSTNVQMYLDLDGSVGTIEGAQWWSDYPILLDPDTICNIVVRPVSTSATFSHGSDQAMVLDSTPLAAAAPSAPSIVPTGGQHEPTSGQSTSHSVPGSLPQAVAPSLSGDPLLPRSSPKLPIASSSNIMLDSPLTLPSGSSSVSTAVLSLSQNQPPTISSSHEMPKITPSSSTVRSNLAVIPVAPVPSASTPPLVPLSVSHPPLLDGPGPSRHKSRSPVSSHNPRQSQQAAPHPDAHAHSDADGKKLLSEQPQVAGDSDAGDPDAEGDPDEQSHGDDHTPTDDQPVLALRPRRLPPKAKPGRKRKTPKSKEFVDESGDDSKPTTRPSDAAESPPRTAAEKAQLFIQTEHGLVRRDWSSGPPVLQLAPSRDHDVDPPPSTPNAMFTNATFDQIKAVAESDRTFHAVYPEIQELGAYNLPRLFTLDPGCLSCQRKGHVCQWMIGLSLNCMDCRATKKKCDAVVGLEDDDFGIALGLASALFSQSGKTYHVKLPSTLDRTFVSRGLSNALEKRMAANPQPDTQADALAPHSPTAPSPQNAPARNTDGGPISDHPYRNLRPRKAKQSGPHPAPSSSIVGDSDTQDGVTIHDAHDAMVVDAGAVGPPQHPLPASDGAHAGIDTRPAHQAQTGTATPPGSPAPSRSHTHAQPQPVHSQDDMIVDDSHLDGADPTFVPSRRDKGKGRMRELSDTDVEDQPAQKRVLKRKGDQRTEFAKDTKRRRRLMPPLVSQLPQVPVSQVIRTQVKLPTPDEQAGSSSSEPQPIPLDNLRPAQLVDLFQPPPRQDPLMPPLLFPPMYTTYMQNFVHNRFDVLADQYARTLIPSLVTSTTEGVTKAYNPVIGELVIQNREDHGQLQQVQLRGDRHEEVIAQLQASHTALTQQNEEMKAVLSSFSGHSPTIQDLLSRVSSLEQRPLIPDVSDRVGELDRRLVALQNIPQVPDSSRAVTEMGVRLEELERKPVVPDLSIQLQDVQKMYGSLTQRIDALPDVAAHVATANASHQAIHTRLTQLEAKVTTASSSLSNVERIAQLAQADAQKAKSTADVAHIKAAEATAASQERGEALDVTVQTLSQSLDTAAAQFRSELAALESQVTSQRREEFDEMHIIQNVLTKRLDDLHSTVDSHSEVLTATTQRIENLDTRFTSHFNRVKGELADSLDHINTSVHAMHADIRALSTRVRGLEISVDSVSEHVHSQQKSDETGGPTVLTPMTQTVSQDAEGENEDKAEAKVASQTQPELLDHDMADASGTPLQTQGASRPQDHDMGERSSAQVDMQGTSHSEDRPVDQGEGGKADSYAPSQRDEMSGAVSSKIDTQASESGSPELLKSQEPEAVMEDDGAKDGSGTVPWVDDAVSLGSDSP